MKKAILFSILLIAGMFLSQTCAVLGVPGVARPSAC